MVMVRVRVTFTVRISVRDRLRFRVGLGFVIFTVGDSVSGVLQKRGDPDILLLLEFHESLHLRNVQTNKYT